MSRKKRTDDLRPCFLCGVWTRTEEHHLIHGSGRRQLAEEDGLKVDLCCKCHRIGPKAVHNNPQLDRKLQAYGQRMWMENTGGTVADFIQRYGKSYM